MKRFLFALMLALFAVGQVSAQMTDDEIIEYVQEQHEAGKSQTAILIDLQRKGVRRDQLLRLKEQFDAAQSATSTSTTGATQTVAGDRIRKANGETQVGTQMGTQVGGERTEDLAIVGLVQNTKEIFGHDIFKTDKLTFEPNMNIATPANYVLGPGDKVLIDVYGTSQSSR